MALCHIHSHEKVSNPQVLQAPEHSEIPGTKRKAVWKMTIRENYEQWLKDFANDPETIRELEAIRDDEKEMEDRFYTPFEV